MVTYKGRQTCSRPYETLGEYTRLLAQRSIEYQSHLDILASNIINSFKILKEDFHRGDIDNYTYTEFLKPLKAYFDNTAVSPHHKINAEEILAEIKKYCHG